MCVCVKQTVAVGSGFATVAAPRLAEGLAKGSSSFPRSSFGSDVFFAIVGSGAVNLKNRNPTLPKFRTQNNEKNGWLLKMASPYTHIVYPSVLLPDGHGRPRLFQALGFDAGGPSATQL